MSEAAHLQAWLSACTCLLHNRQQNDRQVGLVDTGLIAQTVILTYSDMSFLDTAEHLQRSKRSTYVMRRVWQAWVHMNHLLYFVIVHPAFWVKHWQLSQKGRFF